MTQHFTVRTPSRKVSAHRASGRQEVLQLNHQCAIKEWLKQRTCYSNDVIECIQRSLYCEVVHFIAYLLNLLCTEGTIWTDRPKERISLYGRNETIWVLMLALHCDLIND